jgi:hypothetical protein
MLEHLVIGTPLKHTNIPKNGAMEFHALTTPNLCVASITSGGSSTSSTSSISSISSISSTFSFSYPYF